MAKARTRLSAWMCTPRDRGGGPGRRERGVDVFRMSGEIMPAAAFCARLPKPV